MNKEQLNEAPTQFTIPRDLLNDPDRLDVGEIAKKADADAKEAERVQKLKDAAKQKVADILTNPEWENNPSERISVLFDVLVPATGKSESVAGELVRAMMRLLYRDYNDGDKFYSGYGLETCAPSAEFIREFNPQFQSMIEDILFKAKSASENYEVYDDDEYTEDLKELAEEMVVYIMDNEELMATPNDEDSLETDPEFILENKPVLEYDVSFDDYRINELMDKGHIDYSDIEDWLESLVRDNLNSGRVEQPFRGTFVIEDLDEEDYDILDQEFGRWLDQYADELMDEYDVDEDDWDDEDEEDEDMDESISTEFDPGDVSDLEDWD